LVGKNKTEKDLRKIIGGSAVGLKVWEHVSPILAYESMSPFSETGGKIYRNQATPIFKAVRKSGLGKFATSLTAVVKKLPKRMLGADPEALGATWTNPKTKSTIINNLKSTFTLARKSARDVARFRKLPAGVKRDITSPGAELNPKPTTDAAQLTGNMSAQLKELHKLMRPGEELLNLASTGTRVPDPSKSTRVLKRIWHGSDNVIVGGQ
jgi:hypothetical protein